MCIALSVDIYGSFACMLGSFAEIYGSFAEIYCSFAEIYDGKDLLRT